MDNRRPRHSLKVEPQRWRRGGSFPRKRLLPKEVFHVESDDASSGGDDSRGGDWSRFLLATLSCTSATNPTTGGFTYFVNMGSGTEGPVTGEMGYNAWNVTTLSPTSQVGYLVSFTSAQDTSLAS